MTTKKAETLPAVADVSKYMVLAEEASEMREVMAANIGQGKLDQFELERIKVPSGGSLTWEIETLDGPIESKTLEGVVVYWQDQRAYWSIPFDDSGGGSPPDCASVDGLVGVGNPGGNCHTCKLAQFNTARDGKGRGQACRAVRVLAIVRPEDLLPVILVVPPSSIKPIKKYFMRLTSKRTPFFWLVSRFALEKDKSADGITYSKIAPSKVAEIDDPMMREKLKAYAEAIGGQLQRIELRQEDLDV